MADSVVSGLVWILNTGLLKSGSAVHMIQALVFYFLSTVLVLGGLGVITSRNPVHSVLLLILSFFTSAGLFVMLGAEFIGMLMVIVYVGAVAVLFLFVVMMLDINFSDLRKGALQYVPLGLAIGAVILFEFIAIFTVWEFVPNFEDLKLTPMEEGVSNTKALGHVLYTDYFLVFQVAGLVLLVAMIGAIVLTLRKRSGVRRQVVSDQVSRKVSDAMEIRKVTPGTGV